MGVGPGANYLAGMIFLSGDGDSRGWKSWRHCLELGSGLGPRISRKARKNSRVEMARHFNQRSHLLKAYCLHELSLSYRGDQLIIRVVVIRSLMNQRSGLQWQRAISLLQVEEGVNQLPAATYAAACSACVPWREPLGAGWEGFWPHESSTNQKEGHNIRTCFSYRCTPQ